MDKFKRIQNIVNQQDNFRLVSLLTAGGQQLFTFMVFECPCNKELNFMYGMVSMLVPALTLLLLGYILSKKTWKLMTGMCRRRERPCGWRRVAAAGAVLFQISTCAMAAPFTWVAVALLNGNYVVCAVTGTNSSSFHRHLCGETQYTEQCTKELFMFPCGEASGVPKVYRDQVMLTLKAHSQLPPAQVLESLR
ncbi:calcium homeostasis modulator protein 6 [Xyrichtys novacula]|uniref:Calcium homeostasis modulator protein 6 n=1 Tax=Xyrichtys novacula TaxID=13765 RepID=A0AAV1FN80_XYRNO|nr:calcium homeostasis modulator protein 6 [Xyrichtys novacula]